MSWSSVTVEGNILTEPDLGYTVTGAAVATFRMSAGRSNRELGGAWEDAECWVEVTALHKLAEHVAVSLRVGQRVVVVGRLSRRSWEADDGPRSTLSVRAVDIGASLRRATVTVLPPTGGHIARPTAAEPPAQAPR